MKSSNYIPEQFDRLIEIFKERNALYGGNYLEFGNVMTAMFPDGLFLNSVDDWNRISIVIQMNYKLLRYIENIGRGGHDDSLDDSAVYAMMLKEIDKVAREKRTKDDHCPF